MASCTVFEEDEIYAFDDRGYKIGLVIESSEYASSDEEDDSLYYDRVKKGMLRVAWHPVGNEELVAEKDVGLADRSLMPGDVVRRMIKGEDSQRGYVRNTSINCHLQLLGTNKIIPNVDSKDLEQLTYWDPEPGDVTLDSWVGKVEHINETVTLRFPDGALCKVCEDEVINELFEFEDLHEKRARDSEFCVNYDYYVGQQFRGDLADLASATWIRTTNAHNPHTAKKSKGKEVIVTVDKVETKSIDVHWLCRGYAKVENPLAKLDAPPRTLHKEQIKRLKKLDCFEPCSVQIGDKGYYVIKDTDLIRVYSSSNKIQDKALLHRLLTDLGETLPENHSQKKLEQELNSKNQDAANGEIANEDSEKAADLTSHESTEDKMSGDIVNYVTHAETDAAGDTNVKANSKTHNDVVNASGDTACRYNAAGGNKATKNKDSLEDRKIEDKDTEIVESDNKETDVVESDSEYEDEDGDLSDAGSTSSTLSTASNNSNSSMRRRLKKGPGLQTKLLRRKRLRKARKRAQSYLQNLKAGDRVPVEIIYTLSSIEVMWQCGTIEKNIKSTDLFPIHHLDELEFFPGDFVISSQAEANSVDSSYGVVEKVDHAARTCFVRWMKPYQVGKSNKPDESIVSEEVSVYDIKDHPEFKFRPGHVVVRVGGYEETHTEAAGQVYEVCTDGRICIRWADGSCSHAYPQELFLIGDDRLSELGSDLEESSESEAESEEGSEVSWETEEEEEVDGQEEGDDKEEENLNFEPDLKQELDQLLETAKCTLQRLEEEFSQNVDISPWIIHCYREILRINRNCKDLDRMLSAHYFTDSKLTQTISVIRKELKREKAAKIARQVLELFESNCRQAKVKEEGEKAEGQESGKQKKRNRKDDGRDGHGTSGGLESASMVELGASGGGSEINLIDASQQTDESSPECGNNASINAQTPGREVGVQTLPGRDVGVQTLINSHSAKAKDLCQTACRLLKEQIMRVHEDLAKKWQKLRDLGILKALGHEEDDGEEATEADIKALVSSVSKTNQSAMTACQYIANSNVGDIPTAQSSSASSEAQSSTSILIETSLGSASAPCISSISSDVVGANSSASTNCTESTNAEFTESSSAAQDMRSGLTLSLPNTTTPQTPGTPTSSIATSPAAAAGTPDIEELKRRVYEPQTPQTPAEIRAKILYNVDGFQVMNNVPPCHRFASSSHQPTDQRAFFTAIKKELKMLRSSLPIGIYVKGFEDRMDLYTVLIMGPINTPYEDGLFFFDVQLPNDYPTSPPNVHYISFCSDRLNPNLYEDGKVCVSLLGTWAGRGTEVWTNKSSLLQVLISIQGLILVNEPYYNEAGYEKQKGSQQAAENSRMYNEMAICKLTQSMARIAAKPPIVFELEVLEHMRQYGFKMVRRLENWLKLSGFNAPGLQGISTVKETNNGPLPGPPREQSEALGPPEFPLFPCSKGFCLTLHKHLLQLRDSLLNMGLTPTP